MWNINFSLNSICSISCWFNNSFIIFYFDVYCKEMLGPYFPNCIHLSHLVASMINLVLILREFSFCTAASLSVSFSFTYKTKYVHSWKIFVMEAVSRQSIFWSCSFHPEGSRKQDFQRNSPRKKKRPKKLPSSKSQPEVRSMWASLKQNPLYINRTKIDEN